MIYVDPIETYPLSFVAPAARPFGCDWCHMVTDGDIEELHRFAARLGLKRDWFHNTTRYPHYDLTPAMRDQAIQNGAQAVGVLELLQKCSPQSFIVSDQRPLALRDTADRVKRMQEDRLR
jgi:hypothetical protein